MKLLSRKEIEVAIKAVGISEDSRDPAPKGLKSYTIEQTQDFSALWQFPSPKASTKFVGLLLNRLSVEGHLIAFVREGTWSDQSENSDIEERVFGNLLKSLGILPGYSGVSIDSAQSPELLSLVFLYSAFAVTVFQDLIVVSPSSRMIFTIAHALEIIGQFSTQDSLNEADALYAKFPFAKSNN